MMAARPRAEKEDTKRLMRRLAGSLVSWLTFQQAALRSKIVGEHQMYAPIFEVASSRGWKISTQFPLKDASHDDNKESTKFIDFVFYRTTDKSLENDRVAAVELSYVRKSNRRTSGRRSNTPKDKITIDECKLQRLRGDDFRKGQYGAMRKYVMIASKENQLRAYCKSNPRQNILQQATQLLNIPEAKYSLRNVGWIFYSPIKFYSRQSSEQSRWCVMVLFVQRRAHSTRSSKR
jgi:hypothetical protein